MEQLTSNVCKTASHCALNRLSFVTHLISHLTLNL